MQQLLSLILTLRYNHQVATLNCYATFTYPEGANTSSQMAEPECGSRNFQTRAELFHQHFGLSHNNCQQFLNRRSHHQGDSEHIDPQSAFANGSLYSCYSRKSLVVRPLAHSVAREPNCVNSSHPDHCWSNYLLNSY